MIFPVSNHVVRSDSMGDGGFGARRVTRIHTGIDLVVDPGVTKIVAPTSMRITRIGYPYSFEKYPDRRHYRLIVGECSFAFHKIFYVNPLVEEGDFVKIGSNIAVAQDISKAYGPRMIPHVHWEMWLKFNCAIDGRTNETLASVVVDPSAFVGI